MGKFFWWVILFVIAYFLNAARDYTAAFDDLTKMQANRTETCPGISKLDVNRSLSKKISMNQLIEADVHTSYQMVVSIHFYWG